MSMIVFCAVIGAALLHAIWNVLVKNGADKHMNMSAVILGQMFPGILILPFISLPQPESLPYIGVSLLLHMGYFLFLLWSYQRGDLTQIYPIARGSAPLIVALFSVLVLGIDLSFLEILAVIIIASGIISLAIVRQSDGLRNGSATIFALITGLFIAAYSLVDGLGARVAGTPLGYFAVVATACGLVTIIYLLLFSPQTFKEVACKGRRVFFVGGGGAFIAYALVIWAFTQAPIALVSALRETSIIFALLIGVVFLKESINLPRLFSTMVTLLGVALLRFAPY